MVLILRPRVSNIWWSRRLLLGGISQRPISILKLSYLSEPKLPCIMDGEFDDFLPWLERKAGTEISSVLSIGKSAHGRALFALRVVKAGDCILRVPYKAQLASDNFPPEINTLIGDGIGNVAKLAVVVLLEKRLGWDSDWAPYISRLPHPWEMHNTMFWSENELDMIHQSSLYQETISQKSLIEREYLALRQAIEHIPEISETITYMDFMHAYALVISRAWESTKGVVADRNYRSAEQVLIRYGKFSNATLLLDFGFTVPHNIHDQVQIQFNIPNCDPLRTMKLEILQKHRVAINKDDHGFNSPVESFTIKEVRSTDRKGKGIPQSLRAFCRVLCCGSPQELVDLVKEAQQNDGRIARRPLRNISREIEAHQILIAWITQLVGEYEASVKPLVLGGSPFVCERHALRRRMALDLLNGELRVLKSVSAWLESYCTALTVTGNYL